MPLQSLSMSVLELGRRIVSLDAARRLGQALWMSIELPVTLSDLAWSKALIGEEGDQILWNALLESGAIDHSGKLRPVGLSKLLCVICGSQPNGIVPKIVWTLPRELCGGSDDNSYSLETIQLINRSKDAIWIVSPFLEAHGVGRLIEALLVAMRRGVEVIIVAHGVGSLTDLSAQALEELRREAVFARGKLIVYTVEVNDQFLVHPKIILADGESVLLGSANITNRGLGANLEAGVLLGSVEAAQVLRKLQLLLSSRLVRRVFTAL
jgi:phosphatidylserine/phosphatidylglycerophosphate/cardiolipin synthase-like enzyme